MDLAILGENPRRAHHGDSVEQQSCLSVGIAALGQPDDGNHPAAGKRLLNGRNRRPGNRLRVCGLVFVHRKIGNAQSKRIALHGALGKHRQIEAIAAGVGNDIADRRDVSRRRRLRFHADRADR